MTVMRAVDHAEAAAEAVRDLNDATLCPDSSDGYGWPADLDATVAALARMAQGSGQALCQAALWLEGAQAMGRVGHDRSELDADVREAVATAGILLRYSAARAEALAKDLAGVRELTAHLSGHPASGAGAGVGGRP